MGVLDTIERGFELLIHGSPKENTDTPHQTGEVGNLVYELGFDVRCPLIEDNIRSTQEAVSAMRETEVVIRPKEPTVPAGNVVSIAKKFDQITTAREAAAQHAQPASGLRPRYENDHIAEQVARAA